MPSAVAPDRVADHSAGAADVVLEVARLQSALTSELALFREDLGSASSFRKDTDTKLQEIALRLLRLEELQASGRSVHFNQTDTPAAPQLHAGGSSAPRVEAPLDMASSCMDLGGGAITATPSAPGDLAPDFVALGLPVVVVVREFAVDREELSFKLRDGRRFASLSAPTAVDEQDHRPVWWRPA
jgi:hypothetical protein